MNKSRMLGSVCTFLFVLLNIIFLPIASAAIAFEGFAAFDLTFDGVTDDAGNPVADDWFAAGGITYLRDTEVASGNAAVDGEFLPGTDPQEIETGERIHEEATAYGTVFDKDGFATAYFSVTKDYIITNHSGRDLNFTFSYEYMSEVGVSGAFLYGDYGEDEIGTPIYEEDIIWAQMQIIDRIDGADIYNETILANLKSGTLFDSQIDNGVLNFTISDSGIYSFATILELRGIAYLREPQPEVVPVPPALWLFGSGLLGLVGIARRRSNTSLTNKATATPQSVSLSTARPISSK